MECRIGPLKRHDMPLLSDYDNFFGQRDLSVVGISRPMFELATELRAAHGWRTPDALHVAAATLTGCDELWTNDRRLTGASGRVNLVVVP